jgi:hypothetical protein
MIGNCIKADYVGSHFAMVTVPLAVMVTVARPPGPALTTASSRWRRPSPGIFHGNANAERVNKHHIAMKCCDFGAISESEDAELQCLRWPVIDA